MEAMALGRPVLSTYVAGIPELIIPGENGWLIPAGDSEELISTLKAIFRMPEDRLKEMGWKARERVLQRHSIHAEVRKLLDLFKGSIREM